MTRNFPPGDIRVSDADRDAAIAELSEHFQAGRLTQEEFGERSGLALRARTGNDLSELFTDLPPIGAAAQPPGATQPPGASPAPPWAPEPVSPRAVGPRPHSPARAVLVAVIVVLALSGLSGALHYQQGSSGWLVPVIVLLVILRVIRARR
ncbi:MAG TPA: DUF1707 domain-containing protein [Trebonia sp.]